MRLAILIPTASLAASIGAAAVSWSACVRVSRVENRAAILEYSASVAPETGSEVADSRMRRLSDECAAIRARLSALENAPRRDTAWMALSPRVDELQARVDDILLRARRPAP